MRPALALSMVPSLLLAAGGVLPQDASASPQQAAVSSRPATATRPRCIDVAAAMPLREQVGQLFMVAVDSEGLSPQAAHVLWQDKVGSVVLLGNTSGGTAQVRGVVNAAGHAAGRHHGAQLLVATDQEGGMVQRLQGPGFHRIPSAMAQRLQGNPRLHRSAAVWGRELRRAGVNADLAPVADIVPQAMQHTNQPIGRLGRGYGSSAAIVLQRTSSVVAGYHDAGVATAVKHFPGLGAVVGNTDHVAQVVDRTTRRRDTRLAGFAASVRRGSDMVMVSSAIYTRIDPRRMALYSPTVMAMVRHDLRFGGVIISDDMGSAVAVSGVAPQDRATRFFGAGGDLAINAAPGLNHRMITGVLGRARRDARFRAGLTARAGRVLTMKARRGLAVCR